MKKIKTLITIAIFTLTLVLFCACGCSEQDATVYVTGIAITKVDGSAVDNNGVVDCRVGDSTDITYTLSPDAVTYNRVSITVYALNTSSNTYTKNDTSIVEPNLTIFEAQSSTITFSIKKIGTAKVVFNTSKDTVFTTIYFEVHQEDPTEFNYGEDKTTLEVTFDTTNNEIVWDKPENITQSDFENETFLGYEIEIQKDQEEAKTYTVATFDNFATPSYNGLGENEITFEKGHKYTYRVRAIGNGWEYKAQGQWSSLQAIYFVEDLEGVAFNNTTKSFSWTWNDDAKLNCVQIYVNGTLKQTIYKRNASNPNYVVDVNNADSNGKIAITTRGYYVKAGVNLGDTNYNIETESQINVTYITNTNSSASTSVYVLAAPKALNILNGTTGSATIGGEEITEGALLNSYLSWTTPVVSGEIEGMYKYQIQLVDSSNNILTTENLEIGNVSYKISNTLATGTYYLKIATIIDSRNADKYIINSEYVGLYVVKVDPSTSVKINTDNIYDSTQNAYFGRVTTQELNKEIGDYSVTLKTITGVSAYQLCVLNNDNGVVTYYMAPSIYTGTTSIMLTNEDAILGGSGNYSIYAIAKGSTGTTNYINSNWFKVFDYTALSTPQNVSVDKDGIIYWTGVSGCTEYSIKYSVTDSSGTKTDSVYTAVAKVGDAKGYIIDTENNICSIALSDVYNNYTDLKTNTEHTLSVRANSETSNTSLKISSKYSNEYTFSKLNATRVEYSNNVLSWTKVDCADTTFIPDFEVSFVSGSTTYTFVKNAVLGLNTNIINELINETIDFNFGAITLRVRTLGNSAKGYISSNYSDITLNRLATPTNLTVDNYSGYLQWESVENASSYTIILYDESGNVSNVIENILSNNYNLGIIDASSYNAKVRANNSAYISSSLSAGLEITKISAPTNIQIFRTTNEVTNVETYMLQWDKIEGAKSYSIVINGSPLILSTLNTDESQSYESIDITDYLISSGDNSIASGNIAISIKAIGGIVNKTIDVEGTPTPTDFYYISSNTTMYSTIKIATPSFTISNNNITIITPSASVDKFRLTIAHSITLNVFTLESEDFSSPIDLYNYSTELKNYFDTNGAGSYSFTLIFIGASQDEFVSTITSDSVTNNYSRYEKVEKLKVVQDSGTAEVISLDSTTKDQNLNSKVYWTDSATTSIDNFMIYIALNPLDTSNISYNLASRITSGVNSGKYKDSLSSFIFSINTNTIDEIKAYYITVQDLNPSNIYYFKIVKVDATSTMYGVESSALILKQIDYINDLALVKGSTYDYVSWSTQNNQTTKTDISLSFTATDASSNSYYLINSAATLVSDATITITNASEDFFYTLSDGKYTYYKQISKITAVGRHTFDIKGYGTFNGLADGSTTYYLNNNYNNNKDSVTIKLNTTNLMNPTYNNDLLLFNKYTSSYGDIPTALLVKVYTRTISTDAESGEEIKEHTLVETKTFTNSVLDFSNSFSISLLLDFEFIAGNSYVLQFMYIGSANELHTGDSYSNGNIMDSDYNATDLDTLNAYTKCYAPTITISNGEIIWGDKVTTVNADETTTISYNDLAGNNGYIIYINGVEYTISQGINRIFTNRTALLSALNSSNATIFVRTIGLSGSNYISSEISQQFVVSKLNDINLQVEKSGNDLLFTWNLDESGGANISNVDHYELLVSEDGENFTALKDSEGTIISISANSNTFTLSQILAEGTHYFKLKAYPVACGDTSGYISAYSTDYPMSNKIGIIQINYLANVTSLNLSNGLLTWDSINSAYYYVIDVYTDDTFFSRYTTTSCSYNLNNVLTSASGFGKELVIKVWAVGNDIGGTDGNRETENYVIIPPTIDTYAQINVLKNNLATNLQVYNGLITAEISFDNIDNLMIYMGYNDGTNSVDYTNLKTLIGSLSANRDGVIFDLMKYLLNSTTDVNYATISTQFYSLFNIEYQLMLTQSYVGESIISSYYCVDNDDDSVNDTLLICFDIRSVGCPTGLYTIKLKTIGNATNNTDGYINGLIKSEYLISKYDTGATSQNYIKAYKLIAPETPCDDAQYSINANGDDSNLEYLYFKATIYGGNQVVKIYTVIVENLSNNSIAYYNINFGDQSPDANGNYCIKLENIKSAIPLTDNVKYKFTIFANGVTSSTFNNGVLNSGNSRSINNVIYLTTPENLRVENGVIKFNYNTEATMNTLTASYIDESSVEQTLTFEYNSNNISENTAVCDLTDNENAPALKSYTFNVIANGNGHEQVTSSAGTIVATKLANITNLTVNSWGNFVWDFVLNAGGYRVTLIFNSTNSTGNLEEKIIDYLIDTNSLNLNTLSSVYFPDGYGLDTYTNYTIAIKVQAISTSINFINGNTETSKYYTRSIAVGNLSINNDYDGVNEIGNSDTISWTGISGNNVEYRSIIQKSGENTTYTSTSNANSNIGMTSLYALGLYTRSTDSSLYYINVYSLSQSIENSLSYNLASLYSPTLITKYYTNPAPKVVDGCVNWQDESPQTSIVQIKNSSNEIIYCSPQNSKSIDLTTINGCSQAGTYTITIKYLSYTTTLGEDEGQYSYAPSACQGIEVVKASAPNSPTLSTATTNGNRVIWNQIINPTTFTNYRVRVMFNKDENNVHYFNISGTTFTISNDVLATAGEGLIVSSLTISVQVLSGNYNTATYYTNSSYSGELLIGIPPTPQNVTYTATNGALNWSFAEGSSTEIFDVYITLIYDNLGANHNIPSIYTKNDTYDSGEIYTDSNGNGQYDSGELFIDGKPLNGYTITISTGQYSSGEYNGKYYDIVQITALDKSTTSTTKTATNFELINIAKYSAMLVHTAVVGESGEYISTKVSGTIGTGEYNLYASGQGEESDPYIITSTTNLNNIVYRATSYNYFKLGSNIAYSSSFTPISEFNGTLDGDNYTISSFIIGRAKILNDTKYFTSMIYNNYGIVKDAVIELTNNSANNFAAGYYMAPIAIHNLSSIENVTINGVFATASSNGYSGYSEYYMAGIAYDNSSRSTISKCIVNASLINLDTSKPTYLGGIVCANYGTISSCGVNGTQSSGTYLGGIAYSNTGTISSCGVNGTLTTTTTLGGVACTNSGTINLCYNKASLVINSYSSTIHIGGIVGDMSEGNITNCYYNPNTTINFIVVSDSTVYVGGLIGYISGNVTITNCYTSFNMPTSNLQSGNTGPIKSVAIGTVVGNRSASQTVTATNVYAFSNGSYQAGWGSITNVTNFTNISELSTFVSSAVGKFVEVTESYPKLNWES